MDKVSRGKRLYTIRQRKYLKQLLNLDLIAHQKSDEVNLLSPDMPPIYAWLELTGACNLKCVHCYGDFGYCDASSGLLRKANWEHVIEVLSQYKGLGIQFIGGEPLAYKHFEDLLIYAHNKGISRIDIFTNATLFTEQMIETVKLCNASVRISLYGHVASVHDAVTGKEGSFDRLLLNLKKLIEKNVPVNLAVILMKENEQYLDDIIHFIKSLGLDYNGYDVIRNTAPGKRNSHYIKSVDLLKPRYQCAPIFKTSRKDFIKHHFYNSCWAGKFAITAEGDVIPCIFSRNHSCGNILREKKEIIFNELEKYWKTTKDNVEVCRDCEFRYACHDCRPTAEGLTGEYCSKHVRCTYNPYTAEWEDIENYTQELSIE